MRSLEVWDLFRPLTAFWMNQEPLQTINTLVNIRDLFQARRKIRPPCVGQLGHIATGRTLRASYSPARSSFTFADAPSEFVRVLQQSRSWHLFSSPKIGA